MYAEYLIGRCGAAKKQLALPSEQVAKGQRPAIKNFEVQK